MSEQKIALFDLDGTLSDYDKSILEELEKLRSPEESVYMPPIKDDAPEHIRNRADLITNKRRWWRELPKLELGWNVLEIARNLEYRIVILTQGPRRNASSWSGKKDWVDKHLGPDVDITITRDKGLTYGRVLVDDYPPYIERWIKHRRKGLVIMPANESNKEFKHQQVIRYDGTNLEEVERAMTEAKTR